MEKCSICLEDLSDNVTTLEDCQHKFHANCIVQWFRSQHTSCPECRGEPNRVMCKKSALVRFKYLKKQLKKKKDNKLLQNAFKKLERLKFNIRSRAEKRKAMREDIKQLKKHAKVKEYLTKQRACHNKHKLLDEEKLKEAKYLIGCTDFNTGLKAITAQPMQMVHQYRVNNNILDDILYQTLQSIQNNEHMPEANI